jgi:hypothetical protein
MAKLPKAEQCSVEYLRDSARIVAGLSVDGGLTAAIRNAPYKEFTPLGKVWCATLDNDVFVGVKRKIFADPNRPLNEIAIAETLIRNDPSLRSALPLFTLGINDDKGIFGVLTEDFSQNGKLEVEEDKHSLGEYPSLKDMPTDLHRRVYEALRGNIYPEALRHMSSLVCGRSVLIDFNEIAYTDQGDTKDIYKEIKEFKHLAFITLET